jgi:predicted phosphoribosyltransferase
MVFADRRDAGRKLAALLSPLADEQPVVFGLPRGGVAVAVEVADALGAPLDVLTVRKLGAPQNPELAIGAVAEDGTAVVNDTLLRAVGMTQTQFERTLERESRELRRRMELFRNQRRPRDVAGRMVVVVDDGLATGLTDLAAVRALRRRGASRIVVAVPVGSSEAVAMLRREADEVVCHTIPERLYGVGEWYRDFSPVSDEEVVALLAAAGADASSVATALENDVGVREVVFDLGTVEVRGDLTLPPAAHGLVIFAHGSGSSRHSSRNRSVARVLNEAGLATLLFDLLSEPESARRELVFDIALLAGRLEEVTRWARQDRATRDLPIGYFGASTGAAAALRAAAEVGGAVHAVVSRGGRPDLAGDRLVGVRAPTLLIVGSLDRDVLELNRQAAARLGCPYSIRIVEGATHLFEEPGALESVAQLAADWFETYLRAETPLAGAARG